MRSAARLRDAPLRGLRRGLGKDVREVRCDLAERTHYDAEACNAQIGQTNPLWNGTIAKAGGYELGSFARRRARRARSVHQRLKQLKIHFVPVAAVLALELGRLEDLRQPAPALVADDRPKAFDADFAQPDVLVPVDATAQRLLGVVEMPD